MNLTQDQKGEFLKKFSSHAGCPICHGKSFTLEDTIYQLTEFTGKTMTFGGGVGLYPVVVIVCKTCGHTSFVNPMVSGIIKEEDIN